MEDACGRTLLVCWGCSPTCESKQYYCCSTYIPSQIASVCWHHGDVFRIDPELVQGIQHDTFTVREGHTCRQHDASDCSAACRHSPSETTSLGDTVHILSHPVCIRASGVDGMPPTTAGWLSTCTFHWGARWGWGRVGQGFRQCFTVHCVDMGSPPKCQILVESDVM